ncbi:MAG: AroM family protein [Chloroflexota bacterium]
MKATSIRIAAVTIGAAPRPDLTDQLRRAMPRADVVEIGALDDLPPDIAPPDPGADGYPLRTKGPGGRPILADEAWLAPRVQAAVGRGEADGVDLTILLCAGGFATVTSLGPLIRPFEATVDRLRTLGAHRLGVVVPIPGQVLPSRAKWLAAGFNVEVLAGSPAEVGQFLDSTPLPDAIVLDYVGHGPAEVLAAAEATARARVPVIDLLVVAIEAAVATMAT